MDIKPIETEYNGYRFRSRLEARWAVFFDAMGIEYDYEPEGFVGFDGIKYLPDFYLPGEMLYVEVKGSDEQLEKDWGKITAAIDYESTPVSNGLLILGNIPSSNFHDDETPIFSYLWWHEGIVCDYAAFSWGFWTGAKVLRGIDAIHSDLLTCFKSKDGRYKVDSSMHQGEKPVDVTTRERIVQDYIRLDPPYQQPLRNAFLKARQARFEHGEKPTTN